MRPAGEKNLARAGRQRPRPSVREGSGGQEKNFGAVPNDNARKSESSGWDSFYSTGNDFYSSAIQHDANRGSQINQS